MDINLFFRELVTYLQLGTILSAPVRVYGGLMHMMYRLETDVSAYAVKVLNPEVMRRPTAMGNFFEADRLECIVGQNGIPILPALVFNKQKTQVLNGQFFYIYEWFDGKSLKHGDITVRHCRQIGNVLSKIHCIDLKAQPCCQNPINIDWDSYIALANERNSPIYNLLAANKSLLCDCQSKGNAAIVDLPPALSICHNDMDPKNVLWANQDFRIIDLECLGYSNPYLELFELALCWSGYEEGNIDYALFSAFVAAYFAGKPVPDINWEAVYYANCGKLEWLLYNVKRALLIECESSEEQALGIQQVEATMEHITYYYDGAVKGKILACLYYSNLA